jgi:hypothetical protein
MKILKNLIEEAKKTGKLSAQCLFKGEIPREVFDLTDLQELDLSNT